VSAIDGGQRRCEPGKVVVECVGIQPRATVERFLTSLLAAHAHA